MYHIPTSQAVFAVYDFFEDPMDGWMDGYMRHHRIVKDRYLDKFNYVL